MRRNTARAANKANRLMIAIWEQSKAKAATVKYFSVEYLNAVMFEACRVACCTQA